MAVGTGNEQRYRINQFWDGGLYGLDIVASGKLRPPVQGVCSDLVTNVATATSVIM